MGHDMVLITRPLFYSISRKPTLRMANIEGIALMTPTFNQCRTFKQCFKHYKVHANKLLILKTACVLFCVILCGMPKKDKKWDHIMVKTLCV